MFHIIVFVLLIFKYRQYLHIATPLNNIIRIFHYLNFMISATNSISKHPKCFKNNILQFGGNNTVVKLRFKHIWNKKVSSTMMHFFF